MYQGCIERSPDTFNLFLEEYGCLMVKWFKIFGDQYVGFWFLGLVLFALQEVPYMVMPFFRLDRNPIMTMQESSVVLDICEKIFGSLCIVLMTFMIQADVPFFRIGKGYSRVGFVLAAAVLVLNYIGWLFYFNGHQSIGVMLFFLVVLPPLYYVFIGLWRQNWMLFGVGIVFGIVHFLHVYGNLRM